MAAKPDIVAGTITLTTGSATFTGTDTFWQFADIQEGDTIIDVTGATEFMGVIASITDNTSGTLTKPWEGPNLTAEYRIRIMADGQRVTAQARNLIELLGNGRLTAIAAAAEPAGVIEMLPGGSARLVPLTDLVSGANYDVQVADMAARAAFDGQVTGFSVLVADTGTGRAAIFSKLSNASGDWSAAAYVTGPAITLDITEVDEVPYGAPPDVTLTPRPGGYDLTFQIPRGMIIEPGTTTTLASDQPAAVTFVPVTGGYRVNFAIPRGPTGNISGVTTFWATRLGSDADAAAARVGLGAVGAPAVAANNRVALFDTDASLLKDSGFAIQGNALDTSPNALLRFGAFGVGAVQNLVSPDLSAVRPAGRYYCNAPTNGPGGNGWLDVYDLTADYALYEYFTVPGGVPYRNFRDNGVWKGWTRTNLEIGSNANGRYVRDYSTRVQWCFGRVGPRTLAITTTGATAGIFFSASQTHTYPAAFASAPEVAIYNVRGNLTWASASGTDPTATSCSYLLIAASSEPSRICTESIISQGLF